MINFDFLRENLAQVLTLVIVFVAILVGLAAKQKKVGAAGTMVAIVLLAVITFAMADIVTSGWGASVVGSILGA